MKGRNNARRKDEIMKICQAKRRKILEGLNKFHGANLANSLDPDQHRQDIPKPHSHCADVATVHPDAGQPVHRDAPEHIS